MYSTLVFGFLFYFIFYIENIKRKIRIGKGKFKISNKN